MSFCLCVEYNAMPDWPSPQRFDERLEKLLKKRSSGSGFGGVRDMTWAYRTKDAANTAAKTVRAYRKKEKKAVYRNARVTVFEY